MNLLGAVLYDPGTAAVKVTTSLLAMTAFDTTNLRIAFTVPAHGFVRVKMSCIHHGSTTIAQVLLGILEGSTVRARISPNVNLLQTAVATTQTFFTCEFTVAGLSPGAVNWDAAYGVEIIASANGAIKYGGPNNTTTNDAFGAFVFEVWDPRPLKTGLDGGVNVTQFGGSAGTFSGGRPEVNTSHVSGTAQTAGDIIADTNDIQTRLPAALTAGGNMKSDMLALNGGTQSAADLKDFADDGYDPSTNKVQGVVLTDTVTTYTGNTPQTGDSFARIGATGSGLTSLAPSATALSTVQWTNGRAANLDNLNATVSSRATQASVDTIDGIVDDILLDTAEIGAAGAGLTNINLPDQAMNITGNITGNLSGSVGSVTGLTASDVGAIKAKTDNLPSDPADQSLIIAATDAVMTRIGADGANLTALGDARLGNLDAAVSTRAPSATALSTAQWTNGRAGNLDNLDALISSRLASGSYTAPNNAGIAAIKLQTDKFTFTVPNMVDTNVQFVNDVEITGNGQVGTEWGPA